MGADEPYESVHDAYAALGPRDYYAAHGAAYRNPHEPAIRRLIAQAAADWPNHWPTTGTPVLDLAAGSGEATLALQAAGGIALTQIDAIDPYTHAAYIDRTGRPCERISFEEIAQGALDGRSYALIVCSFAMHLAAPSLLPPLCIALRRVASRLLILTPHKRPIIKPAWGWTLRHELLRERVRARFYLERAE